MFEWDKKNVSNIEVQYNAVKIRTPDFPSERQKCCVKTLIVFISYNRRSTIAIAITLGSIIIIISSNTSSKY